MRTLAVVVASAVAATTAHARPRTSAVWEDVEPRALAAANTNTIFLNRCAGGCTVSPGTTDSRTNRSSIVSSTRSLSAFSRGDAVWNAVVACVKDVFSPFGVEIVTTDPGTANHFEIMIAGTPGQLGLPSGVGGISPYNCSVAYIPNSLVFVFDVWGTNIEDICATAAQEIAHSFRLDHVIDPSDPMTYYEYAGRKRFVDAQVQCGSDCVNGTAPFGQTCFGTNTQSHTCTCTGQNTQSSVAVIASLFGRGAPTPPEVRITSPAPGAVVTAGFPITVDATDDNGVSAVELRIDGELADTAVRYPYAFNAPATLADGRHAIEVTAIDVYGASSRAMVQVAIGQPCASSSDCTVADHVCVAGRCVAGPNISGGLGTSCTGNDACVSGQCATDGAGASYCVEACVPDAGHCPAGFECLAVGSGGVCWPSSSGGCASHGSAAWLAIALGVLGLGLARRPAARPSRARRDLPRATGCRSPRPRRRRPR